MISRDWTLEERVAIVREVLMKIQSDIPLGKYGADGRPNIQTALLILSEPKEELENYRARLEAFLIRRPRSL